VTNQIKTTKRKVKAVMLVGGFGQNTYLMNRIVDSISKDIRVMRALNGWTAVVRGALMKGLDDAAPTMSKFKVDSRRARKHYGTSSLTPYDNSIHERSRKIWDPYYGIYQVETMEWFLKMGDAVKENVPSKFSFSYWNLVSDGPKRMIRDTIGYSQEPEAPLYPGDGVGDLVTLTTDLSEVPLSSFKKKRGKDGKMYYFLGFAIEMTCYSAHTTYAVICDGIRYDAVTAEYV
jgi:hypothetical protein